MHVHYYDFIYIFSVLIAISIKAQSCVITPLIPSTLITAGGVLHNDTQNTTIACYCRDGFNRFDKARWFFDEARILLQQNTPRGHPYVTLDRDLATLIIPTFNESYSGIYTCGNENYIDNITAQASIQLLIPVRPGLLNCVHLRMCNLHKYRYVE